MCLCSLECGSGREENLSVRENTDTKKQKKSSHLIPAIQKRLGLTLSIPLLLSYICNILPSARRAYLFVLAHSYDFLNKRNKTL